MGRIKQIARNAMFLYIRMFVSLLLTLYTSRIVLNNLGIEDFGVFSIIAGVISALTFCSIPLTTSALRFLSMELGKGHCSQFKLVFKDLLLIHILFVIIIIILFETIGLYFTLTQLNLSSVSANNVFLIYQFSCITFVLSIIRIPFSSSIIAQEKMQIYAYLTILETILKLVIAILIIKSPINKLVFYALCLAVGQFLIMLLYIYYGNANKKQFEVETKNVLRTTEKKTIVSFMLWNLFSGISSVCLYQGTNILLNVFCGPIANASRAIAVQINSAIDLFASNIRTAFTPASFKEIVANNTIRIKRLLNTTIKFSIILILFVSIPIFIEIKYILTIWLGVVPDGTENFVRLMIIAEIVNCISSPFIVIIQGMGNIRRYQITNGITIIALIPISYVFMKKGFSADTPMIIYIIISYIVLLQRIYYTNKYFPIDWRKYVIKLSFYAFIIPIIIISIPIIIHYSMPESILRLLIITCCSTLILMIVSYYFILNKSENELVIGFIKKKLKLNQK